jgi:hypothetical protein
MGEIKVMKGARSVVSVSVDGLKTEFLTLE